MWDIYTMSAYQLDMLSVLEKQGCSAILVGFSGVASRHIFHEMSLPLALSDRVFCGPFSCFCLYVFSIILFKENNMYFFLLFSRFRSSVCVCVRTIRAFVALLLFKVMPRYHAPPKPI